MVFLDHDLGGKEYVDPNGPEETGSTVVRWIIENKPYIRQIVIHSLNHNEAKNMAHDLEREGYSVLIFPFTVLRSDPTAVFEFGPRLTEHDKVRLERALNCDKNDLLSVEDAVRGLQSTDHPSLCPLHDILMKRYQELKKNEN